MNNKINIKNALISVFDKEGLEDVVYKLNASGVNIYSTGEYWLHHVIVMFGME